MLSPSQPHPDQSFLRAALLLAGILMGASAVIMIKASTEQPFLVASYRLLIAALVLAPFFFRDLKNFEGSYGWKQIGWSTIPALALAIHFMSWVIGTRMTQVANASLIVNLTPVVMPFLVWGFFREKINRKEIFGTLFTLAGLFVLGSANFSVSKTTFSGDLICFGSMLFYALYMALAARNRTRLTLWLYMVPLYFIAGVICLLCALPFTNPIKPYTTLNVLMIVGLGLIPTVFSHTILNYSMRFFRGQVVTVTNLTQPIFAGVLGYLIFGELPRLAYYAAAVLIFIGVLIVLFSD
jgi:drug/metabolite transporter (DMT)-like permease